MKEKRYLGVGVTLACLILLSGAVQVASAATATVTVQVDDHTGSAGIAGVETRYGPVGNPTSAYFGSPHSTDSSGTVTDTLTVGQTYQFQVDYHHGSAVSDPLTVDANPANNVVHFQTILLTLRLEDCNQNPLDGGSVRYGPGSSYSSSFWPSGGTGTSNPGETEAEFFPGTYSFEMGINHTTEVKSSVVIPNANTTLTWTPTMVTLGHFGPIAYGASALGHSWWFKSAGGCGSETKPMFPVTYYFSFDGYGVYSLDISGCTFNAAVVTLKLLDHNGNPLSGGTARGGYDSNTTGWHVSGATDSSGLLREFRQGNTNLYYEMKYNNTVSVQGPNDVSVNPCITFQTNLLTLRLEDCSNNPLDDGNARYGIGSTYTSWWFPGGATGTSASGETEAEFFPGTYSFEMQYKGTVNQKIDVVVPDSDYQITWQTTSVTLGYCNGKIRYGGSSGTSNWFKSFDSPASNTMELLPGNPIKFSFDGFGVEELTFSGCEFKAAVVTLKLLDHNGNPLSGGTARGGYDPNTAGWHVSGATDSSGLLREFRQGNTNLYYEMKYNNTVAVQGPQDVSHCPCFEFQTNLLTLRLEDCAHNPLDGGKARYGIDDTYTTWWFPGDVTGTSASGETEAEFFPGTYSFEMQYKSTADQKISVVVPDADYQLTWQTTTVTLHHSHPITYGGPTGDYENYTSPMELLPGTYIFNFRDPAGYVRRSLTFSGCDYEKTVAIARVVDYNNVGLPGRCGTWHVEDPCATPEAGWGPTDANGVDLILIDGLPNANTTVCLKYDHDLTDCLTQRAECQSTYTFTLKYVLHLSSSVGGDVVNLGEGYFLVDWNTNVLLTSEIDDPLFVFSHYQGNLWANTNPYVLNVKHDYDIRGVFESLLDVIYVDDNAPNDVGPFDLCVSDPCENGTLGHPFDSIQEAIEVAAPGSTVMVMSGTYPESLDFLGKSIKVISADPNGQSPASEYPVVEAQNEAPVVTFSYGGDPNSLLKGFVLTGANGNHACGVYAFQSQGCVENCLIVGNKHKSSTSVGGGGVWASHSELTLISCTLADNYGGTIGAGLYAGVDSDLVVLDSILWGNSPVEVLADASATVTVNTSDVAGSYAGTDNLDVDPVFVLPGHWEHALNPGLIIPPSQFYAVWVAGDYHLDSSSPCIDAGDPLADYSQEPMPNGGQVNMGAYGNTSQAAVTP